MVQPIYQWRNHGFAFNRLFVSCQLLYVLLDLGDKFSVVSYSGSLALDQGVQSLHAIFNCVVDHCVVILLNRVRLFSGPLKTRLNRLRILCSPAYQSSLQFFCAGGMINTSIASGNFSFTFKAPWISISSRTSFPASMLSNTYFLGVP